MMSVGKFDVGADMGIARSRVPVEAGLDTPPNDTLAVPLPDGIPSAEASGSASTTLIPAAPIGDEAHRLSQTPSPSAAPSSPNATSPLQSSSTPASGASSQALSRSQSQSQSSSSQSPLRSPRPISVSASSGLQRTRPASALVSSGLCTPLPKPRSNSSLQSSRPAPPSPANSRPPSQILSSPGLSPHVSPRASAGGLVGLGLATPASGQSTPVASGRDRAGSASSASATGRRVRPRSTLGTSSLVPPSQEAAELATVSEPAPSESESTEPNRESDTEDKSTSCVTSPVATLAATLVRRVIVRDYAYPTDDERFLGLGPNRPRSNWCEGEPEPAPPEPEEAKSGWGGLSLGSFGWGGFLRGRMEAEPATVEDTTDYTLTSAAPADHDNDSYWSDDDDYDAAEDGGDSPDPDGLFRAAYAFEPEGVNEMGVDVGDLLDVRGRGGGGDGWVVAVRLDNNQEGLVPEGYLEPVDEDECPDGWEHLRKERAASEERGRERSLSAQPEEEVLIETRERTEVRNALAPS